MSTITVIPQYEYDDCTVLRWVDGDTLDMQVRAHFDMGFKVILTGQYTGRFRLHGINAFEKRHELGPEATAFSDHMMPLGTAVCAKTFKDPDNFGRYLAILWLPGEPEVTVNAELLSIGLAVPFAGRVK